MFSDLIFLITGDNDGTNSHVKPCEMSFLQVEAVMKQSIKFLSTVHRLLRSLFIQSSACFSFSFSFCCKEKNNTALSASSCHRFAVMRSSHVAAFVSSSWSTTDRWRISRHFSIKVAARSLARHRHVESRLLEEGWASLRVLKSSTIFDCRQDAIPTRPRQPGYGLIVCSNGQAGDLFFYLRLSLAIGVPIFMLLQPESNDDSLPCLSLLMTREDPVLTQTHLLLCYLSCPMVQAILMPPPWSHFLSSHFIELYHFLTLLSMYRIRIVRREDQV